VVGLVKILITDKIHEDGVKLLREFAEVEIATDLKPAELLARVGDFDVLVVRSATKVTEDVIRAGEKLKVIARAGAGLDNIDTEAAGKRGIKILNAPEAPTVAVAELVIALVLSFSRKIPQADLSMKSGKWEKKLFLGGELRGKTLGIVGSGKIGQAVGERAKAFGMKLLLYDVVKNEEFAKRVGAKYVGLDVLLREADFITLHVPLTPKTERMIGSREFSLMKPTAVLINTSRGKIIDEAALLQALEEKKIAGACLDVYEKEPPIDSPLLKFQNVVLTPHIGASTVEAQREAAVIIANKIKMAIEGGQNPWSWFRRRG
jgi:D-3-phosphoglycerate dehydrogenase